MNILNEDQIYYQNLKQAYEKQKYITGTLNDIESFLSSSVKIDLTHTYYLSNYLVDIQSNYLNNPTRFNSYQKIIDVLQDYNYASNLNYYSSSPIPASSFVGSFLSNQIDYIFPSQINGNTEVNLIGEFLPSQIAGVYASNLEDLLQSSNFHYLYTSNIYEYEAEIVYVSNIAGLISSDQIQSIYTSQILNILNANQINYIYVSQVQGLTIPSSVSNIVGGLVKNSQIDSSLFSSSKTVVASFVDQYQWDNGKNPGFNNLYFCGDTSKTPELDVSVSSDPNSIVQAMIYCTLIANFEGVYNPTIYYSLVSNGCAGSAQIYPPTNTGFHSIENNPMTIYDNCMGYLLGTTWEGGSIWNFLT